MTALARGVPETFASLEIGLGATGFAVEEALEVEDGASRPARGCNREAL